MSSIVECPVCEDHFELPPQDLNGLATCPSCQRTFEISPSVLLDDDHGVGRVPTIRASPVAQASFQKPVTNDLLETEPSLTSEFGPSTESKRAVDIRSRYDLKKRSHAGRFTLGMIALAMLTCGLAVVLISRILGEPSTSENPDFGMVATENSKPNDRQSDVPAAHDQLQASAEDQVSAEEQQRHRKDIPPQKLKHFGRNQVDDCWKLTQPHLLSLQIQGPAGTQQATGTIVDSRGWVVTSYQAVKDAWQIEVTAAAKSFADSHGNQPLNDLARGFIATDPEHDLALLAVNRRFVVSFADVQISTTNRLVAGEHLLQCGPPSENNPYGATEIQIQQRCQAEDLKPQVVSKISRMNLKGSDHFWLTTNGGISANPGMPLFKTDGTLVAMNVMTDKDIGYTLPVTSLQQLIDSSSDDIQPFKMPVGTTASGNSIALPIAGPGQEMISRLNRYGKKCEPFQWLPEDREQYESLQAFSRTVIEAFDFVTENEDEAAIQLVQQRLEFWESQLAANLGRVIAADPDRLSTNNDLAAPEIKKGNKNHVVFFGSVYISGIESPKQILKFDGMETFVNVPFDPDSQPMLPGSNWLFFVQTMPLARRVNINVPGEGIIPTESANILYAVGPINRR